MSFTPSVRLSSSLRACSPKDSLKVAASIAMSRGIGRVVDTTWLDKIGIPVFAAIRPDAIEGSLCVHAGKGFTHDEAKIGAYMEALEFSFAVPGRNATRWSMSTPPEVVKSFGDQISFSDFCPQRGAKVALDSPLAVVSATEILAGLGTVLLPAELVYHPFLDIPGVRLYGTSTNGLASGNTILEAVVHGLAEVMERHVRSLEVMVDHSMWVELSAAPSKVRALAKKIQAAGLTVSLRYSKNEFGLAYFSAYIMEPEDHLPIAIASGHGCHPISEVAAVRALAEAAQSRLTHIHGGRDDIIKRVKLGEQLGRGTELSYIARARASALSSASTIRFEDVPSVDIVTLEDAQACLFAALSSAAMNHVAVVHLTPPEYPVQVVKVVVPGAEFFEHGLERVGARLMNYTLAARGE